jgi:hypothetical protein
MVDLHFPYPASVCAIGLVGTSIVSWTAVRVLRVVPASTPVSLRCFVTRILPTGLFQALSMQLGNTAYLHLSGEQLKRSWGAFCWVQMGTNMFLPLSSQQVSAAV